MTEPPSSFAGVPAVGREVDSVPDVLSTSNSSSTDSKRSASEAFQGDSVGDLKDKETTLDDVLVSPLSKKSKLLDVDLPDVDDNEEFPQQTEDMDEDLAIGLENGESDLNLDEEVLNVETANQEMENRDLNVVNHNDVRELAPPDEEEAEDSEPLVSQENEFDIVDVDEEEEAVDSEPSVSQSNGFDIVDVDEEEEEEKREYEQSSDQDDEEDEDEDEDEDELETAQAIARAQNQTEARQLLLQLDDSTRSKLCLTAMEKYGEELFYGLEDARDAILVAACAQDSILSLMRDAIRMKDLYARGSSAAAPLELDDDDDDDDEAEAEEGETGGYEDDEEDAGDEEEKPAGSTEDDDDEIVVISEGEEGDGAEDEPCVSANSESHPPEAVHTGMSGVNEREEDLGTDLGVVAGRVASDDNDEIGGENHEETTKGETLSNVGTAGDSSSGMLIADSAT